jgi:hypothetical protein
MIRRVASMSFPALIALAVLLAFPGVGGDPAGRTTASTIGSGTNQIARGSLTPETLDDGIGLSADVDDNPDHVIFVAVTIDWPATAVAPPVENAAEIAGPIRRPRAALPRAPPAA